MQSVSVKNMKFKADGGKKALIFSDKLKKHKKQDKNELIKGIWVRLSQAGEYEHLRQVLSDFHLQGQAMSDFFAKKGSFLLRCAIFYWDNPDSLRFIISNVPQDILQHTLCKDHYSVLESFLRGESILEKMGEVDEERLKNRFEKFKLLLQIDREGLEMYKDSEYFKTQVADKVKSSFQTAIGLNNSNKNSVRS